MNGAQRAKPVVPVDASGVRRSYPQGIDMLQDVTDVGPARNGLFLPVGSFRHDPPTFPAIRRAGGAQWRSMALSPGDRHVSICNTAGLTWRAAATAHRVGVPGNETAPGHDRRSLALCGTIPWG